MMKMLLKRFNCAASVTLDFWALLSLSFLVLLSGPIRFEGR